MKTDNVLSVFFRDAVFAWGTTFFSGFSHCRPDNAVVILQMVAAEMVTLACGGNEALHMIRLCCDCMVYQEKGRACQHKNG